MIYLESTAIEAVEYHPSSRTLLIWFPEHGPYTFVGVPASVYQGLLHADSAGRYYKENIEGDYQAS